MATQYHGRHNLAHGSIRPCGWLSGNFEIANGYAAAISADANEAEFGFGLAFPSVEAAQEEIERWDAATVRGMRHK